MAYGTKGILRSYLKTNWYLALILVIFFLAGIIFGSIGVRNLDGNLKLDLSDNLAKFFAKMPGVSLDTKEVVKDSLAKNLYAILGMYVLGLSVVGTILVPVLLFTRGFILGFTVGFLIYDLSWKGILITLISIVPQNLIFIPTLILGGLFTLTFSLFFTKGRLMFRNFEAHRPILIYSLGMLLMAVLMTCGCLLESYITPSLIKYTAAILL